jgi:hypothetical protein
MSSKKENEGHLIQRVNRYVSTLGKCPVVKPVTIFNWDIHENDEMLDYPPQDSRNVHYCELIDVYQGRKGIKRFTS